MTRHFFSNTDAPRLTARETWDIYPPEDEARFPAALRPWRDHAVQTLGIRRPPSFAVVDDDLFRLSPKTQEWSGFYEPDTHTAAMRRSLYEALTQRSDPFAAYVFFHEYGHAKERLSPVKSRREALMILGGTAMGGLTGYSMTHVPLISGTNAAEIAPRITSASAFIGGFIAYLRADRLVTHMSEPYADKAASRQMGTTAVIDALLGQMETCLPKRIDYLMKGLREDEYLQAMQIACDAMAQRYPELVEKQRNLLAVEAVYACLRRQKSKNPESAEAQALDPDYPSFFERMNGLLQQAQRERRSLQR